MNDGERHSTVCHQNHPTGDDGMIRSHHHPIGVEQATIFDAVVAVHQLPRVVAASACCAAQHLDGVLRAPLVERRRASCVKRGAFEPLCH